MNTILQDLIEHHIWANDALLAFCEGLPADQLSLTGPGAFGTVEETWAHIAANEEGYLKELAGVGIGQDIQTTIFDSEVTRDIQNVRPVLAKTADRWRAIVAEWPQNAVRDFEYNGEIERLSLSVFVVQVINHATEHRAHIRTILSSHGIVPPEIDAWHWAEATGQQA